jgi:hypothetical protein
MARVDDLWEAHKGDELAINEDYVEEEEYEGKLKDRRTRGKKAKKDEVIVRLINEDNDTKAGLNGNGEKMYLITSYISILMKETHLYARKVYQLLTVLIEVKI